MKVPGLMGVDLIVAPVEQINPGGSPVQGRSCRIVSACDDRRMDSVHIQVVPPLVVRMILAWHCPWRLSRQPG